MSGIYDFARESFATAKINWTTDDIRALLVRVSGAGEYYSPDFENDKYLNAVPNNTYARASSAVSLTGKTATAGALDADNPSFTVAAGPQIQRLLIYQHTGDETTSILIALCEPEDGPFVPDGTNITWEWPDDDHKIFQL